MTDKEELILKHQLEEWHLLNDYLKQLDLGYLQTLTILVSTCTLASGIIVIRNVKLSQYTLMLVPLAIIGILACLSYQFRITAILRGHLAALEEKMNTKLGENIHLWNFALVDTYMANNNMINQIMMIPMISFLFIFAVIVISEFIKSIDRFSIAVVMYLIIIVALSLIVLIPFLNNEKIRKEVYYHETNPTGSDLPAFYQKYIDQKKDEAKKIYDIRIDDNHIGKQRIFKNALCSSLLISFIGFGVMLLFHYISPQTNLRNFFSYYAATIGDGVCLPALCGFAVCYLGGNSSFASSCEGREGRFSIASIFIDAYKQATYIFQDDKLKEPLKGIRGLSISSSLVGAIIQASWIIRDDTPLNWTIPRQHHFNLPGWYHAAYFVLMFGLIMYFLSTSFIIYKEKEGIVNSWLYPSIWLSGVAYLLMNTIDDRTNNQNYVMVLFLTGLLSIVVYLVLSFIANKLKDTNNIVFIIGVALLVILSILLCHFVRYANNPITILKIYELLFK